MFLMDFLVCIHAAKTDYEGKDGTPGVNSAPFSKAELSLFYFCCINSHMTELWELYSLQEDLWVMFRPDSEQD